MTTPIITYQGSIQFRRGTASEWTSANPILKEGELGTELDTRQFKIGDGASAWNDLPYGGLQGADGSGSSDEYIQLNSPI